MAAANPAESLGDETVCSICLDYFTDPVMTNCGHNFCRSCITQSWEGRDTDFPCPRCRKRSRQRNLRPNRQLANMTEIAKKFSQTSERPKEENLCKKHKEELKLFCQVGQRAMCVVCSESQNHRYHTTISIEQAVQEYKEKFKMHLKPVKKNLKDLLKFKSTEGKKAEKLKSETERKRLIVESEFEELHQFLNKEKQIFLSRLEEEEKKILQRMRENESQLEQQSFFLKQLISEIEEKNQQPANELLKDVNNTLSRCQKMKFPVPEAVSTDLKMGFQLSFPQQLKKWVTKYEDFYERKSHPAGIDWWVECGRYTANVTLDPETAHPNLILSQDRKSVRSGNRRQNVLDTPQRFDIDPCVLGSEGFSSGRHYWEVEVGDNPFCQLGVCNDSVRRKGEIKLSPEEGLWTLGLWYEEGCWVRTSPVIELPLSERPRAVGILLDYEAGKVSFYDADSKSHVFTFTNTFTNTFTGKLRPFFWTNSEIPLRIRQVPAWN
ncbi:E3 ubiquitin-protein ligase TRIM39-like isoform X1 [Microcaecilia unicolor]|uniref:E3 ubiquitin-protein ligase TRIM39-like isoform X1 n=1 Tax=Microcaecilia unicolor TaxID=1415580 RepID=A0A6P7XYF3_9AMPH|nr:E3 ubiquitin-protein ligase TRIM39-like isoform X1 [Microcaecilia unicolor]